MKALFLVLSALLIAKVSFCQRDLLVLDEHDKYIYYQVVDMPKQAADTLHHKTVSFLEDNYPKIRILTNNLGKITCAGKLISYGGGISILKHEKGEIDYTINIEFKDQKYRYWITDFFFKPYGRNRYGNFVPKQGIEIPLETGERRLDKKELDNYLDEAGEFCTRFGEDMKQYLINNSISAPKKVLATKKIVTDKW